MKNSRMFMTICYFNSQPHKEADGNRKTASKLLDISTHSLTRRLTDLGLENSRKELHFNSQPHKEADHVTNGKNILLRLFQLTASQGG